MLRCSVLLFSICVALLLAGCGGGGGASSTDIVATGSEVPGASAVQPPAGSVAAARTVLGVVDKLQTESATVRFLNLDSSPVDPSAAPIPTDFSGAFTTAIALPRQFKVEATVTGPGHPPEVYCSQYHGDWNGGFIHVNCLTEMASVVYDLPSDTPLPGAIDRTRVSLGLPSTFDVRSGVETDGALFASDDFRTYVRSQGGFRTTAKRGAASRTGIEKLALQVDAGKRILKQSSIDLYSSSFVSVQIEDLDDFPELASRQVLAVGSLGRTSSVVAAEKQVSKTPCRSSSWARHTSSTM